jgi:hypothetical protein
MAPETVDPALWGAYATAVNRPDCVRKSSYKNGKLELINMATVGLGYARNVIKVY